MAGFGNLCVFKADLDIGEFLHWFLQTGNMSPRKRVLSPPLNFPSGLVPKLHGSRKHRVTAVPMLSFSPASVHHSSRLNKPPTVTSTISTPQLPAQVRRTVVAAATSGCIISRFLHPCISAPFHRHSNPKLAFRLQWRPPSPLPSW